MATSKIKKGDTVRVIAGVDKGKEGKVLEVKNGKVKVEGVNTINVTGKVKRMGRFIGKRSDYKKAIVKLAAGETIEFFEA